MAKAKFLAWCVHAYTASGLLFAALMAVCIVRGDAESLHWAIALMVVTTFIDTTDGWLARRARVKEILPQFDGRRLDDIIDFQTYTSLPLLFIWRAELLPASLGWVLLFPLLASVYGFSQSDAKTEDNFFLGFPSYWNVVAMYLYWLHAPVWLCVGVLLTLAALTFVPSLYLYTTRGGPFSKLTNGLCLLWAILLVLILARAVADPLPLVWLSFGFPVYYFVLSWWITLRRWLGNGKASKLSSHGFAPLAAEPSAED
ncbi:MAG: CDP-alcohol phosphatidyltransferase family protein [Acidobacteria bacterium]|nr:CDP-alcohol phosphatidyltransferase family protein [Acidobacteriota bacterium]